MGTWFRSESMLYYSLVMSEEAAPSVVRELGRIGCTQFIDMNPTLTPFQRRYVSSVSRCDNLERMIMYLHGEIKKLDIAVKPGTATIEFSSQGPGYEHGALDVLESKLAKLESSLRELNEYNTKLSKLFNAAVEHDHVFHHARTTFAHELPKLKAYERNSGGNMDPDSSLDIEMTPLTPGERSSSVMRDQYDSRQEFAFDRIYGILDTAGKHDFERMLFRATRGNVFLRFADIEPSTQYAEMGVSTNISCFVVLFKSKIIDKKVRRICDACSVRVYSVRNPDRLDQLMQQEDENKVTLRDTLVLLNRNMGQRYATCESTTEDLENWLWLVRRQKSVYHNLNMLEAMPGVGNILRGKVWVMASKVADANASIQRAHNHMRISQTTIFEASQGAWPECPTHFVTNKYTVAFQEFVNTYGIPGYKEINPALFTAATFPFLFGMMYGDVGHGTILMLAGLYLILTEKKAEDRKTPEMVKSMYMGRYMLFAMGCCGIYAGLLYNDFFSLGMNLFGSSWTYTQENGVPAKNIGPYGDEDAVYPFGADPAWKISSNELLFFNSMKMKMSVIVGITQMIFGICLRGMNSRYFKSSLDFYCEFVPMILFATSFFGYMIVLIFIKWSIDWNYRMGLGSCAYDINGSLGACSLSSSNKSCYTVGGKECNADTTVADMCPLDYGGTGDGCQPPNLITTLINIVLSPGNVVEPMFANQGSLQSTLLSIAFICVPWLLLVKPLYLKRQHDKRSEYHIIEDEQQSNPLIDSDGLPPSVFDAEPSPGGDGHGHGHGKAFNFSEIFIHQTIETIEFVLGMVSNTASYLRLWALSLAHTELAAVFWEKTMLTTINTENPFYIFMGFYVFAGVTTGVLLCMDVLECFLHALRLHWVEFQNKFYKASGYKFEPYDFKAIMDKCTFD